MSDTPRTDAAILPDGEYKGPLVWAETARQLERELAEAREDAMDHKRMLQSLSKTQALDRAELDRSLQHIMKQRDMLAEAMTEYMNFHIQHGFVTTAETIKAWQALVAVKGGSDD